MKSSGPLFTRQNPFQTASRVDKVHYHPSCKKSLSKKEKKTSLSPVHLNQRSSPLLLKVRPESHQLVETQASQFASTDEQPVFTEAWPSTDSGSSPTSTTTSCDMGTLKQSARARKSTASSEFEVQEVSLLSKYIDRFRHAPPQSREERHKMDFATGETPLPFRWMSPSSPCSTPTKTKDNGVIQSLKDDHGPAVFSAAGGRQCDRTHSPSRGSLSTLSDISQVEFDDTDILQLQERANRLLLSDECTLSDGFIHVSSEGVGCSDFSSPVSVDEATRRPFNSSVLKSITVKASSDAVPTVSSEKPFVIPSMVTPTRPEEDILFQWRLRRKIEQAREWSQPRQRSSFHSPTFSWQAPIFSHPTVSGQIYTQQQNTQPPESSQKATHPYVTLPHPEAKEAHLSCPPFSGVPPLPDFGVSGSSVSQPQAIGHVPAHMHLLCDVLPCPIQSSHAKGQQSQNVSQSIDESLVKVAHKKTQVPGHLMNTYTDEPLCEHMPSPSPASTGALGSVGPSDHERSERNRNEKAKTKESVQKTKESVQKMSFRKQKRSRHTVDNREQVAVPGSINKVPQKVLPPAEQQQQRGSQEKSSVGFMDEYAPPPPSPIHSALGQVVSEVLFVTADSSPTRMASVSSASPRMTSAPLPSSTPPCDTQKSMEVISRLLQEADDSDEKEFEDDPLLQVLRKQRSWVKEQISEVNECLDKQQGSKVLIH